MAKQVIAYQLTSFCICHTHYHTSAVIKNICVALFSQCPCGSFVKVTDWGLISTVCGCSMHSHCLHTHAFRSDRRLQFVTRSQCGCTLHWLQPCFVSQDCSRRGTRGSHWRQDRKRLEGQNEFGSRVLLPRYPVHLPHSLNWLLFWRSWRLVRKLAFCALLQSCTCGNSTSTRTTEPTHCLIKGVDGVLLIILWCDFKIAFYCITSTIHYGTSEQCKSWHQGIYMYFLLVDDTRTCQRGLIHSSKICIIAGVYIAEDTMRAMGICWPAAIIANDTNISP